MEKINLVINALEDVKAFDIVIYDMREKSPFFDYFIISSATSQRQLQAAVRHITDDLTINKFPSPSIEGKNSNSWILIDCKDIIVNVFTKEEREYYDLEKMLTQIKELDIKDFQ